MKTRAAIDYRPKENESKDKPLCNKGPSDLETSRRTASLGQRTGQRNSSDFLTQEETKRQVGMRTWQRRGKCKESDFWVGLIGSKRLVKERHERENRKVSLYALGRGRQIALNNFCN